MHASAFLAIKMSAVTIAIRGKMLAAVWVVKSFRHHLLGGQDFRLVTDHQLLTYLMGTDGLTGQYSNLLF